MKTKRRFWVIMLVAAISGGIATYYVWNGFSFRGPDYSTLTEEEISQALAKHHGSSSTSQAALERIAPEQTIRVAIGHLGLSPEAKQAEVSDLALAQLTGSKGIEFVERQALDKVLRELQLSLGGLVRANDAVRAGKLLRADWFLLGSKVVLAGTNYVVVRMVDAHTGMLREAGVFQSDQPTAQLAAQLTTFTRQCRQNAAEAKGRTYLSVGGFEDLSLNGRLADFPQQIRTYLIAAYQSNPSVTLLEREFANVLLKEIQLDLAGLTEASATNQPAVMYSGYWMVDGSYQSYETTGIDVELRLRIQRMFGRHTSFELREKPGAQLFEKVKSMINSAMQKDHATLAPTRWTEAKAQMSKGEELVPFKKGAGYGEEHLVLFSYTDAPESESRIALRRRNIEEAIRAFETVLLLDPDNRPARIYLAGCFRQDVIDRHEEARDLYRQLLESPINDQWSRLAQLGVEQSFRWARPAEKLRWYEDAAASANAQPAAKAFYQKQISALRDKTKPLSLATSDAERLAEDRLFQHIAKWPKSILWTGNYVGDRPAIPDFVAVFATNHAVAAEKLAALTPRLRATFTNIAPHLLAGIVLYQTDTNAPVIREFERSLDRQLKTPAKLYEPEMYRHIVADMVFQWAMSNRLFAIAARSRELNVNVKRPFAAPLGERLEMAFCWREAGEWQKALEIFQSYSNRPVRMASAGIWGDMFDLVFPGKEAAVCRQKLRLPELTDLREFDMGESVVCLHYRSDFACEPDGVWLGIADLLMHLTPDLQTNFIIQLPIPNTSISRICIGSSNVWVATEGAGLVQVDKATRKIRLWTINDGLLMNDIKAVHLAGDSLWIGYGNKHMLGSADKNVGGLGRLTLSTGQVTSFSRSMLKDTSNATAPSNNQPPGEGIFAVTTSPDGDVWMLGSSLLRYQPEKNIWERRPESAGRLVSVGERLYLSHFEYQDDPNRTRPRPDHLGVVEMNFKDGQFRPFKGAEGLPLIAATALASDGRNLWAGGRGYVACLDTTRGEVVKLAYVKTQDDQCVWQIGVGGGYVWASFDWHLYRYPLSKL